jgi:hypothetical protein
MSHSLTTKRGNKIPLGNHVAAILCSNKDREALAEEVLLKQEHNLELQQQVVSHLPHELSLGELSYLAA